ncbi:MAG: glycerol-3-phosphate 1-O-acyltransferase PlsY [Chitinophagales bacterium]|nr:glycerol-3-phosphate 1-O-acyltransferase PlsY [Chitinophagales bacterium]
MTLPYIIVFILAYLIGAVPSSVWIGKWFYHKDVRNVGSGNAGATNTFRVLGARAGIIVLAMDVLKGVSAVMLAYYPVGINLHSDNFIYYKLALGITAALGHIFPVYLKFKGGKGVATFLGVGLSVFWMAALLCIVSFLLIFLTTRYVSLGSLLSSALFPIVVIFVDHYHQLPVILFAVAIPCIIFYTHRKNIVRLLNRTENKLSFKRNI